MQHPVVLYLLLQVSVFPDRQLLHTPVHDPSPDSIGVP